MRIKLFLIFLTVYFCKAPLISQVKDSTEITLSPKSIEEVQVISPYYITQARQWPGAYSKITVQQLNRGNSYNLQEQINKVPGVMMQQGAMSTNRITIRGIGSRTPYQSNRIKAYWGEVPLTEGDGVTSIEDIELYDISALEILKGPSSALFGAGMGGTILLQAFDNIDTKPDVLLRSEAGSYSTFSQQAAVNWNSQNTGNYTLSAGALSTHGYRENSDYQRYNITFKAKLPIGNHYLQLLYNYRYLNGQIPSSLDSVDFQDHPEKAAFTWRNIEGYEENSRHLMSIGWIAPLKTAMVNQLTLFSKVSTLNELRPFNRLKENRYSIGVRDRFKYKREKLNAELGFESMLENSDVFLFSVEEENLGQRITSTEHLRYYLNGFALLEYSPNKRFVLQGAFNVNKTFYQAINEDYKFQYHTIWSPRIGINYALTKNVHWFASLGHGFSAPSLEEAQLPDGSFNPDIKPEEGMNYETGLRYQSANQKLNVDIAFYKMEMTNLLVTERDAIDQFYGKNAGKTAHQGIESSLQWILYNPQPDRSLQFIFNHFISQNKFRDFTDDDVSFKGNHLPGIPKSNWSADVNAQIKSFSLNLSHQYYGEQYLNDANTKKYTSYHKSSAKLTYHIQMKRNMIRLYMGVDNLFNNHYASMLLVNASSFGGRLPRYYYPGKPFNMYGGLEVKF